MSIFITPLGQTGFRFCFGGKVVYVDPYLSDYVEEIEGPQAKRQVPVIFPPEKIEDADWVIITHSHIDHCDPKSIFPISQASPNCKFVGPAEVCANIVAFGVSEERIICAEECWASLGGGVEIVAVPAAHPTVDRDTQGGLRCVGYIFRYKGKRIYHSGDTVIDLEIIKSIERAGGVDVAFLSINEKNYYRDQQGIIGNMSVRDAFGLAEEIGAEILVPMHWDMFQNNCVFPEEIELLYEKLNPKFKLRFNPTRIETS